MTTAPSKESWNIERFLAAYQAVAERRKGWAFEQTPDRIVFVQKDYESGRHNSLAEYAEARYELDQLYGDP
jgi:hypothetical protein